MNLGYNAGADDRGPGLNVGAAVTRTDLSYDQRYLEYVPGTAANQAAFGTLTSIIYPQTPATYETPGAPYLLGGIGAVLLSLTTGWFLPETVTTRSEVARSQ